MDMSRGPKIRHILCTFCNLLQPLLIALDLWTNYSYLVPVAQPANNTDLILPFKVHSNTERVLENREHH